MLLVELTDTGAQVARDFRPIAHQHQKQWLAGLTDKEQQALIKSLQRLQATLRIPILNAPDQVRREGKRQRDR
jgi:DNA-binding MarR family transcriptional regulator